MPWKHLSIVRGGMVAYFVVMHRPPRSRWYEFCSCFTSDRAYEIVSQYRRYKVPGAWDIELRWRPRYPNRPGRAANAQRADGAGLPGDVPPPSSPR